MSIDGRLEFFLCLLLRWFEVLTLYILECFNKEIHYLCGNGSVYIQVYNFGSHSSEKNLRILSGINCNFLTKTAFYYGRIDYLVKIVR